jgi:V/A-type H+-transporting ATPase subunit K
VSNLKQVNVVSRVFRLSLLFVFLAGFSCVLIANPAEGAESAAEVVKAPSGGAIYYAIAATMGIASMSAAYAVGKIGAAVMGAAAEKPEIMGKAIAFVGLGEGIALFGFLISLFLIFRV